MANIIDELEFDTWLLQDIHKCLECGKEDESIDGLAGNPRKWFCSDECATECRRKIDEEEKEKENGTSNTD